MSYRIAAAVRSYNTERWILPFMEMLHSNPLVEKILVLQGKEPWKAHVAEHGARVEKDLSEDLIRHYYPDVEIKETTITRHCAEGLNEGVEALTDYDFVLRIDSDMFMIQKDWDRFLKFISEGKPECVKANLEKVAIGYAHDLDHGHRNHNNIEPLGISTKHRYEGLLDFSGPSELIEWDDWTIHHLKGWKGTCSKLDWIENKIPSGPENVYARDVVAQHGPWLNAPQEIKDMFERGQEKIDKYKEKAMGKKKPRLSLIMYQNSARYFSTGDYFLRAAPQIGIDAHLIDDPRTVPPLENYDVAIHFYPGCPSVNAKNHLYLERDSMNEILFREIPQEKVFYTQWPKAKWNTHSWGWTDKQVVMHAADPDFHKSNPEVNYSCEVVFCGRMYGERMKFLNELEMALHKINIDLTCHSDGKKPEEYVRILNTAPVILAPAEFGEINRRIFEAMAIGCCVTSDRWRIERVGEDKKHFWNYGNNRDVKSAVKVIKHLFDNPELIEKTAQASREHIIENHTYLHRLKEILRKGGEEV